ncbi:hypothetical protein M0R36_09600 [bacterium]|jgi:hypothetical protein|nr:hypothetical protein [bacterium]
MCQLSGKYLIDNGKRIHFNIFFKDIEKESVVYLELDPRYMTNSAYHEYVNLFINILNNLKKTVYLNTTNKTKIYKPSNSNVIKNEGTVALDLGSRITGLYFAINGKSEAIETRNIIKYIDSYNNVVFGRYSGGDTFMNCIYLLILNYLSITKKKYDIVSEAYTTNISKRYNKYATKKQHDEIAAYLIYKRWLYKHQEKKI